MNFKLENFKPVKSAEIKVNDLTLIFGDNNTGKTYIAYALYGLLSQWDNIVFDIDFFTKTQKDDLLKSGRVSIKKDDLDKKELLEKITAKYAKNMEKNVFSSTLKQSDIKIGLSAIGFIDKKEIKRQTDENTWLLISIDEKLIEISIDGEYNLDFRAINHLMLRTIFDMPNTFISVSERLGISLFQKDLDENMANVLEHLKKNKDLDPMRMLFEFSSRYALPVKDNIDFMRAIDRHQKSNATLEVDLSTHIASMFDGNLKHNGREIRFFNNRRRDNKMDIPLHLASASVRALSNLYFFLKHKAKAGDLIIIDEPESHLSLKKQRLLAKLIADCINHGLKILLTTHSDTLVLELNNLMMLNNDFDNKDDFMEKHSYEQNHMIDSAKVSAYIAEKGGVTECKIDKYGMEVDSMDKAIDDLNTVRDGLEARL